MLSLVLRPTVACAGLAVLISCSGFNLRSGAPQAGSGGPLRPVMGPSVARANTNVNAEVRRVCRSSRPSGFIAIDYVASDSTLCPLSPTKRSSYGVALVVRYVDLPVGEEIAVCADERVPTNWIRVRNDPDDPRCPPEDTEREPRPTVMTIRRAR